MNSLTLKSEFSENDKIENSVISCININTAVKNRSKSKKIANLKQSNFQRHDKKSSEGEESTNVETNSLMKNNTKNVKNKKLKLNEFSELLATEKDSRIINYTPSSQEIIYNNQIKNITFDKNYIKSLNDSYVELEKAYNLILASSD